MAKKTVKVKREGPRFLVVRHNHPKGRERSTMMYTDPSGDLDTLVVRPGLGDFTVTDPLWLDVPSVSLAEARGDIRVELTDTVPVPESHDVDPELEASLDPAQRAFILALRDGEYTEQMKGVIRVDSLMAANGVPRPGTMVTKSYLVNSHAPMLQAIVDLERRTHGRHEVLSDCQAALDHIGAL